MLKAKTYCLFMALCLLFSSVAESRICFLSEGDGRDPEGIKRCLTNEVEADGCTGYLLCTHPKQSAQSCTGKDGTVYYDSCCPGVSLSSLGSDKECTSDLCTAVDGSQYCSSYKCKSQYKTCDKYTQIGAGSSCTDSSGTKYLQCTCSSEYNVCGKNQTNGNSGSCYDELSGVTKYRDCFCDVSDNDWTTQASDCACGVEDTCSSVSGGVTIQTYYKCKANPLPENCKCGYKYRDGLSGCYNGCNDSEYIYQGVDALPANSTCEESFKGITGWCARGCVCSAGFYDYNTQCTKDENPCDKMGYKETACDGDYVSCPYDANYKKCLGGGGK